MARPLRLAFAGGLYHITSRGDRREDIYENNADSARFLTILGEVCERINWYCHAYCLMSNHYHLLIETPGSNLSRGLLAAFGRRNSAAIDAYRQFVSEGRERNSLWQYLRNQVFLGDEAFVEAMQARIDGDRDLSEIPVKQRRPPPKLLSEYKAMSDNRDAAIMAAHLGGGYTLKQIGDHFGRHYSRVSRILRQAKGKT